jgi:hypothetical protein
MDGSELTPMGFTNNVVDGQIILAAWGNEIRDRTVQVFATVAERDSQWATAPNGAMCVTVDTNTLWQRAGGIWVRGPLNTAWGVLSALTSPATDQTVTTGEIQLLSSTLNATLTISALRYTRMGTSFPINAAGAGIVYVRGYVQGTMRYLWALPVQTGWQVPNLISPPLTNPAGSLQFQWTAQVNSGPNITIGAGTFQPGRSWVEDCGPSPT